VISIRKADDPKHCLLFFACQDGFIKVFSLKDYRLVAVLKGVYGSPLCIDIAQDQAFLVAGFEDDSFVIYSLKGEGYAPLVRGIGHKSFLS